MLASSIVVLFLASANAPSPLYQTYESAWHVSALIGTIAFATYAVAVIGGLLWLDRLSEGAVALCLLRVRLSVVTMPGWLRS